MSNISAPRDNNRVVTLVATSSVDGVTPVVVYADPTTHRVLVDSNGSITLQTNGTPNGSQTLLNLVAGTNMTITDNGSGSVTFAASGGAGSGITRSINSISVNTTAGAAASTDYVYLVSGTTTLTLPTAVGNSNLYTVKNVGVATVTINTTSAQTIDGSSSVTISVANTSLSMLSDGSNWRIV